jgi:hypothetical protein
MENNKYYTPEINEFHVGFEYEEYDYKSDEWLKWVCDVEDLNHITSSYIQNKLYSSNADNLLSTTRVKYLDKEDFKDLSFIQDKVRCTSLDAFVGWNKTKEVYIEFNRMQRYPDNQPLLQIFNLDEINKIRTIAFSGVIKNISELKKLIQQLNIS